MELWNSLPDNLRYLDLSLGQFRWALKTHLFWRSLWRLVIVLVRWLNFLTYLLTLQKKQLKQYISSCKTVADTLKITLLNPKTSSAAGGFAPWPPTRGSAPWTPLNLHASHPHSKQYFISS